MSGALRGAVGFLTRLPVHSDGDDWDAFRRSPWTFPVVGALVGGLLTPVLALPIDVAVAAALPVWCVVLVGINHLDGVADLGDAAVVHGGSEDRVSVLKDTTVGVGATAAVALLLVALALAGLRLATLPLVVAAALVVAVEVGGKLAMAGVACLGTARHEGLGSALTEQSTVRDLPPALLVALVVVAALAHVSGPGAVDASSVLAGFLGALGGGTVVALWANRRLAGVNGDVFGAVNEVGRVVGLHVGVIAWTLS